MPALLMLKAMPWKLIGLCALAFAILALFAHDRITVAQNGKLKAQIVALNTQLRSNSTKRDEQKQTTSENIGKAKDKADTADKRAKVIEAAPLPGNCATPREILDADI